MRGADIYRDLGALISTRRRRLGLTQEKLAQVLGISRASLANVETGRQKVLVDQLLGFAAALRMKAADLLPLPPKLEINTNDTDLPMPDDLNREQRDQVARVLAAPIDPSRKFGERRNEKQAKKLSRKSSTRAS
jgi:transcriptional regulator with XRE-family HTH domain